MHSTDLEQDIAQAPTNTRILKVAQDITVIIWDARNAKSGSGVIVRCDKDCKRKTYTVLTARHAVEDNQDIRAITPDGQLYYVDPGCIRFLPDVDLALLQFISDDEYSLAKMGNSGQSKVNTPSFIAGFPSKTVDGPGRKVHLTSGKILMKSDLSLGSGFTLVCSNTTLQGMSGGPVLNAKGELIGIVGGAEDVLQSFEAWSYAVPIDAFLNIVPSFETASFGLASIPVTQGCDYLLQGNAKSRQGDKKGAILDYTEDIRVHPHHALSYYNRGNTRYQLGDQHGAIEDYSQSIVLYPSNASAFNNRGGIRYQLDDKHGAIDDFSQAITLNPKNVCSYSNRGIARLDLGDIQGAIEDCTQAIALNPDCNTYTARGNAHSELGDKKRAVEDYSKAAALAQQQNNQLVYDQLQVAIEELMAT